MIEIDLRAGQLIAHTRAEEHDSGKLIARQQEEVLLAVEHAKHTELEMAHFIDCIESGTQPMTDGPGSLEGLQVIWKLYEAEEKKCVADLRGMGLGTWRPTRRPSLPACPSLFEFSLLSNHPQAHRRNSLVKTHHLLIQVSHDRAGLVGPPGRTRNLPPYSTSTLEKSPKRFPKLSSSPSLC